MPSAARLVLALAAALVLPSEAPSLPSAFVQQLCVHHEGSLVEAPRDILRAHELAGEILALGPEGTEAVAAMTQEAAWKSGDRWRENHALTLFARLAGYRDCPADTMVVAIVLANAWLYALGDDATRNDVLTDCALWLDLYAEVAARQKAAGLRWSIERAPFAAKLLWADRVGPQQWTLADAAAANGGRLDVGTYREFVDSYESLEEAGRLVERDGLLRESVTGTAAAVEAWVHERRTYRSSMENLEDFNRRGFFSDSDLAKARAERDAGLYETEFLGKKRRWDEFNWLNRQMAFFDGSGEFRGDCGTTTTVQMGFYRAAGLAPISLQWIDVEGRAAYTHNFPGYFHPGTRRVHSVQKPVFYAVGGVPETAAIPAYLHYTKPVWHPWKWKGDWKELVDAKGRKSYSYEFYPGELADQFRIASLLSIGWDLASFGASLWSSEGLTKGRIFTAANSPAKASDSDGDGVPDVLEKSLGTRTDSPDSDGDGRSDRWEIDCLWDPLARGDSPAAGARLDGLASPAEYGIGAGDAGRIAFDALGDYRSTAYVYDVDSMFCSVEGNALRLAVTYAKPIERNPTKIHSFMIDVRGGDHARYWAQWVGDWARVYRVSSAGDYVPVGSDGLEAAWIRDAEFSIPLAYFGACDGLVVRYWGCGFYDGKDQIGDDECSFLRVPLSARDFARVAPGAFVGAERVEDPRGDEKALVPGARWDIASVSRVRAAGDARVLLKIGAWNDVSRAAFGLKTVYARDPATGSNWWLQWYSPADVGLWTWKDGAALERREIDTRLFDCFKDGKDLYLAFPVSIFPAGTRLETRFLAGGTKADGSIEAWDDSTEAWIMTP